VSNETDVRRGQRAQEVIENEVYAEAWAVIEQEIITQWRQARNADDREQLHQLLLMHGKARTALETVMRTGQVAQAELQRKQSRAEAMTGHLSARY
jgi:SH3-like domain-containing protein